MTDWQKTLLLKNLNKLRKRGFFDDDWYERYYTGKDAIRDTFAFSGKTNTFKALYNFFVNVDESKRESSRYTYGYKNADGEIVEVNRVTIKIICKLQKVTNETT